MKIVRASPSIYILFPLFQAFLKEVSVPEVKLGVVEMTL
jgi:hypothetical protein